MTKTWLLPNAYYTEVEFLFPSFVSAVKKKRRRIVAFGFLIETDWMRVGYLLGLAITKTIPGLRLAKFPLFSFKASTVVLWDLAMEESVSPRCTL